MKSRTRNTKNKGIMEFLVYKEGDGYVAVCLTFDIVEEGSDPVALMASIKEAAELHLETVINQNLSEKLLNRYAPEEYWQKYFDVLHAIENHSGPVSAFPVVSPYSSAIMARVG